MTIPAPTSQSMTLQQLRLAAQRRADMVLDDSQTDRFITVDEWNEYLNDSIVALYDALIQAQPIGFYTKLPPYTFSTTGAQYYPLPDDFYLLQGVDCALGGAANGYVTLTPFNFAERNKFSALGGATAAIASPWTTLKFRVIGNQLFLGTPGTLAQAGLQMQVWYVPKFVPMVDIATITLSGFGVLNPDGTTGPSEGLLTFGGYTAEGQQIDISLFAGDTNAEAAIGIATEIAGMFGPAGSVAELGVVVEMSMNVLTLSIPATAESVAFSSDSANAACSADTIAYGTTTFDGFSGWLAWVYLDAARKALIKEDSDTAAVERELATLNARIEKMAARRDMTGPSSVVDVNATGNGWNESGPWWP